MRTQLALILLAITLDGFDAAPADAAEPVLMTTGRHPMQYYLSRPSSWTAGKTWPIVVTVDGGNKAWLKNAQDFAKVRDEKNYPFIIATPIVLTNGGTDLRHMAVYNYAPAVWNEVDKSGRCSFDLNGLQAVVTDIQERFSGHDKYFMTGWSAGGHLTWAMIFQHPEKLLAAAPSGGNYIGRCMTVEVESPAPFSNIPERAGFPVKVFDGEVDTSRPDEQVASAMKLAESHGYNNVQRVMVPGMNHSPMPDQVLAYFYSLWKP